MVDDDVLTFNPPKLTHPLPERLMEMRISARRGVRKITYPVYLPRVLRPGGDGRSEQPPNRHAGEKLDAPTSPHADPPIYGCQIIRRQISALNQLLRRNVPRREHLRESLAYLNAPAIAGELRSADRCA